MRNIKLGLQDFKVRLASYGKSTGAAMITFNKEFKKLLPRSQVVVLSPANFLNMSEGGRYFFHSYPGIFHLGLRPIRPIIP